MSDPQYTDEPDGTHVVITGGRCLSALCGKPARYLTLFIGGYWYPQCVECCADTRHGLPHYVEAVRDYEDVA